MDQNLKHRLTGAVILVSLAVIFIPVILEGPDNEWTPLSQGIPESPQLDYKAGSGLSREMSRPEPAGRIPKLVEKPADKPEARPGRPLAVPLPEYAPAVSEEPVAEFRDGWYVQLGSFSREENASGLSERLKLSGYDAGFQETSTTTGYIYRVMVGPDSSREIAEEIRDRLAEEFKLEGIVINNPG